MWVYYFQQWRFIKPLPTEKVKEHYGKTSACSFAVYIIELHQLTPLYAGGNELTRIVHRSQCLVHVHCRLFYYFIYLFMFILIKAGKLGICL
jgi:hypothetical protein